MEDLEDSLYHLGTRSISLKGLKSSKGSYLVTNMYMKTEKINWLDTNIQEFCVVRMIFSCVSYQYCDKLETAHGCLILAVLIPQMRS